MQMLYHTNIGAPLLGEGAELRAPLRQVAPWKQFSVDTGMNEWHRYCGPKPDYHEVVYLLDLLSDDENQSEVLLKNAAGSAGVGLGFNIKQLPCFSLWKNLVPLADGYVTGIEPATNFPNQRSHEVQRGRIIDLVPSDRWEAEVRLDWHTTSAGVSAAEQRIEALQGSHEPIVLEQPDPEK